MKKMSKGMLMTTLICGAVYLSGSPVYASELQEFSLDEYVVTAARTETKLVDTPANITVVDAQTIEERHYQDVSEVLKDVPGATVLDTGIGTFEKAIKLNGDERVLVLIDGRRVSTDMGLTNSARASVDMNQLPDINLIERIEVLKGAGGALYGSDAVGGVINIITKKTDVAYGNVYVGVGSNGTKDYSAMYSGKEGKTGFIVSASQYSQDYYKYKDKKSGSTKRWDYPSDYENNKITFRLDQELSDVSNLTIGYDYSKYDGMSPSSSGYNSQEKETQNIYAKYDWTLNDEDNGYIQYYHNELDYTNLGIYDIYGSPLTVGYISEKTNGVDIQQELTINDSNKLVIGANWRKADVKTKGDNNYDESIDNVSFFVTDTWEFIPTWTLNTGVRYDNHNKAGNETTMSAGLNKKFNDASHAYFNWSQVFKAPNADDLYYYSDMGAWYGIYKGNQNLKPETGDTWTLGYASDITEKTSFGINYFESNLDDAINYLEVAPLLHEANNVDKQKKRGMELTLSHKLNNNTKLQASYTYIKVENNDKDLGYKRDHKYMPNNYRVGINYNENKFDANLWLRYGSGGDTIDRGYNTAYLESNFITVDLSLTYKPVENISIFAKAYNLFNEAYADFAGAYNGSYNYPAQSRRFIVGAEYKF